MDFKFSLANCKRTSTEIPAQTNDHFYNMRKCCYVSVWINFHSGNMSLTPSARVISMEMSIKHFV